MHTRGWSLSEPAYFITAFKQHCVFTQHLEMLCQMHLLRVLIDENQKGWLIGWILVLCSFSLSLSLSIELMGKGAEETRLFTKQPLTTHCCPHPLLSLIVPGSNFHPYRCWTIAWLLGLGRRLLSTVSDTSYPQPLSYTKKTVLGGGTVLQSTSNCTQERWLWGFWGRGEKTLAGATRALARHEKTWCRNTSSKRKTIFLTYKKVRRSVASEI